MQRWLSGLRRTIGNRVYPKGTGGSNPLLCAKNNVVFCRKTKYDIFYFYS